MSNEWASILLERTRDPVAVIDESGVYDYVSGACTPCLGYEPEALVGKTMFELLHEDDEPTVRNRFDRVVGGQRAETVRYRHRTAAGGWTWLESRISAVDAERDGARGGDGNGFEGYVVSSRDITDLVASEQDRRHMQERLEAISRAAGDVLWLYTGDWDEVLFVNPAYEEVFGRPIEELEVDPMSFLSAVHPDDTAVVREAIDRLTAGESVDVEFRVNPTSDYDRWVWVQGEPIVVDGEVTKIAGFTRDITDRRRRERQLAVMDNLLRHTLRNEMCLILGNAEMIAREAETSGSDEDDGDGAGGGTQPTTAGRAEIIRRRGERLLESADKQRRIIDLLTDEPVPEPIDLVAVASEVVERTATDHSISIETAFPESAPAVAIDEIGAAIQELLENAIEHAPDGRPELAVSVRFPTDGTVTLTVEDDCPPIPELEFRVLAGDWVMDDVYHSSGLGLWLVYWIVDIADGRIGFTHADDGGNRITISLSRATEE